MDGIDVAPTYICIIVSVLTMLLVPHLGPERLIADRWRYYILTGVATIVCWVTLGYLVTHFLGSRRPLMVLFTMTGMTMLPLALGPTIGWLNARFDHSPGAAIDLRVCGYTRNKGNLVAVRFRSSDESFPQVEATTPFLPQPVPPIGADFQATYHSGAFGIRWLSTLGPTVVNENRKK